MGKWECCPGSILALYLMWVEFVVFLRSSSLHKSNTSKFQFDQDRERACKPTKAGVDSSLSILTLALAINQMGEMED